MDRFFPFVANELKFVVSMCRNQGSRGKVAKMIKIMSDVKFRYLHTYVYLSGVWAGYEHSQYPTFALSTDSSPIQPLSSHITQPRCHLQHPPWCPNLYCSVLTLGINDHLPLLPWIHHHWPSPHLLDDALVYFRCNTPFYSNVVEIKQ
jgi:hypothetical protein